MQPYVKFFNHLLSNIYMFQKSDDIFIFNNSVKTESILIIFGKQNPEKIGNKQL